MRQPFDQYQRVKPLGHCIQGLQLERSLCTRVRPLKGRQAWAPQQVLESPASAPSFYMAGIHAQIVYLFMILKPWNVAQVSGADESSLYVEVMGVEGDQVSAKAEL